MDIAFIHQVLTGGTLAQNNNLDSHTMIISFDFFFIYLYIILPYKNIII